MNSRRLPEADAELTRVLDRDRIKARTLAPADCEGDAVLCGICSSLLSSKVAELRLRTRYLGTVPWLFVKAGTQDGARRCLVQVEKYDMDAHDPLTQHIMQTLGQDIKTVADGGDVSTALAKEIELLALALLDESAGEGVHRADTLEKTRAASSSMRHIKQSARERQVLRRLRAFVDKHGARGRKVLRYEFHAWKRILQTKRKHKWRTPKKLKAKDAMSRIYREDDMAQEDWSAAVSLTAAHETERPERVDNEAQLANEYLVATLKRNETYSIDVPRVELDPDGRDRTVTEPVFWRLNDICHGNSRPHVMPTVESVRDLVNRAPVALNIQLLEKHDTEEQSEERPIVFATADEEWVMPTRIAPYKAFATKLFVWKKPVPSETAPGCIVLDDRHKAKPNYGPLDKKCPTWVVVWYVIDAGWKPVKALCDHATSQIAEFDHRIAVRMKPYYQCLLAIDRCILLTSHLPSQEPGHYYELLLRGVKAEPGLRDKDYIVMLNTERGKKQRLPLPLPPPSPPDDAGDEVILAVDPEDEPPSKRRGGGGPGRRTPVVAKPKPAPPAPPAPICPPIAVEPIVEVAPPTPPSPLPLVDPPGIGGSSGSGGVDVPPHVGVPEVLGEADSEDEERDRQRYDWKDGIDGAKILCQRYHDKKKNTTYINWILQCPRHTGNCLKKKI